ncbi:MAG: hypothetical protein C7B45_09940 [Sulfobacillus acidophilus]|uniref:Uncharacterized protein n=1 Tax=Sulfobacillus acidophilus TaxID=53633 RepID=A0A2T2WHC3_9FIRM|nr:MAG: hypothetical protein C7B45_09940 [Sulfobacillus acidophilus]
MLSVQQQLIGRHFWVKRSPEWSAVLDTLALPLFHDDERNLLVEHVDLDRRTIDWSAIHHQAESFSQEARTLLRIAHALYNGGDCQLSELEGLSSAGRSAAILLIAQRYRE